MKVYLHDKTEFDTGYDAEWLYQTWEAARRNQITVHLHLGSEKMNILLVDAKRTFDGILVGNSATDRPPAPG